MIKENLHLIRRNMAQAAARAGRDPQAITLVCVTKEANLAQTKDAISCGITDIGENRIQDAVAKYKILGAPVRWHLVGHLQTNKVKRAVEIFDIIHSVDSLRLAEAISREAAKINKVQDILVEVNTSGEESKFGVSPEETPPLIKQIALLNNIRLLGLMTVAPMVDDPQKARPYFKRLREILHDLNVETPQWGVSTPQLSMGMSNDYQVAIQEGATMVRIGSAIFK